MSIFSKFGGSQVLIKPASNGTGVKAGVRELYWKVLELRMYLLKSKGSSNPHNLVKATLIALLGIKRS